MRLVYLSADQGVPIHGSKGASVHVRSLVGALRRRGHELTVVTTRSPERPPDLDCEIVEPRFDRALKELRKEIAAAPDGDPVLAGEVHKLLLNGACLECLEEIHARRGIDAIYERYSLWSTAGASFAARHEVPWVLEVNAPLVREQADYRELALRPVAAAIEGRLLAGADAVFVPSSELAGYVHRRVGRRPQVHVTPNGADLELFTRPSTLPPGLPGDLARRFVVVFSGSLKAWHGIDALLDAYRRLRAVRPEAHLLVLGAGPLLHLVQREADRLGAEAITVAGAVPHGEVPAWLRCADVGVAPYPALEDFYFSPIKVAEYMAAGLPVVASAIGQVREMVVDGETGVLVPPGDPGRLAEALERLAGDHDLRARCGRAGRRRAESTYCWAQVAATVEGVLSALARGRRRGAGAGRERARLAEAEA